MEKTTAVALLRCFFVAVVILAASHPASAQSVVGAQISGVVTDLTGAVIPGAQVKATQTESGQTRTTVSASNGAYSLPNLPVGPYRLEVTTGDVLDADREDRGPEGSPESAVVDHITNVTLLTAVKQLNPEQQECIVLRFLQGFSVAETAQAMNKNEGAIKALQYRAVRALNRLLPEGFHQ